MRLENNQKNRKPVTVTSVVLYALLIALALIYLLPLVWMLSVSLKSNREVLTSPFTPPSVLQLGNYIFAWTNGQLGVATLNSVIVCFTALVVSLLIGAMAAFAIARMRLSFLKYMMQYFLIGMMIPVHCVLIPLFVRFSNWHMTNERIGLIIPYITFSLPMTIFLMVGFFKSMPNEIFEAACIDGCSIYGCFVRIALPLSRVGMFVAGIMTFVGNWNELLLAMVFISDTAKKTLPVTLTYFVGPYATNYVQMFAAIIIAIAPTIVVYSIFSNQIVDGLTTGAVKG
ncbi:MULTISPECIES: carbohydrate ABC transporter permease [Lacrimispora]|jgi:raffinose/stachyose/melibiose transport system permease protein|uniref:carbohydrate ABC transporter permease n=1 Tax=Lacrimispora TaxID=2719231 RepID=UPI000BE42288|nr:carbohydrate ABC transporter permease [Lacrimispora amygdalina]MDK2964868.1 raffinose/stachyose/melibiose transport system permease protein [Lacrimispora sp.]